MWTGRIECSGGWRLPFERTFFTADRSKDSFGESMVFMFAGNGVREWLMLVWAFRKSRCLTGVNGNLGGRALLSVTN